MDAYLALAAVGDRRGGPGAEHADAAERLADDWQIPLFTRWFRGERDRYGF